jgi:acetyl esterase
VTLDRATREYLDRTGALGAPRAHETGPGPARAAMTARQLSDPPGPAVAAVTDAVVECGVEGGDAPIVLRWVRPAPADLATPDPAVIVYLHGGGWVLGELDGFEGIARRLAVGCGCDVAMVDYRLAPEHPHPAAIEDAWRALEAVREQRPGVPILVAGDSAGGNLAAALALRARAAGIPLAGQVLIYPVVDADFDRPSYRDPENQLLLDRSGMQWFWDQYLPDRERRRRPDAAPLRAADHRGVAPAIVITAEHDVLADEGLAYARALQRAGVPVAHRRFEGQLHGFAGMALLPASAQAVAFIGAQVRALLSGDRIESAGEGNEGRE